MANDATAVDPAGSRLLVTFSCPSSGDAVAVRLGLHREQAIPNYLRSGH